MNADQIEWLEEVFGSEKNVLSAGDVSDYFDVISEAFSVHVDRERIREGLWKDYPAEDQYNQVKVKIDRVVRSLEQLKKLPDTDGYQDRRSEIKANIISETWDIINYAVFGVRILRGAV